MERKKWEAPNPFQVMSIIPGSVTEVLVKPGDKVKKGSKLMIYEAMKMKNVIVSPFDAVVESVEVKAGDKLPKGALLVILK
jgi:biotin carboxyl carrier protein